VVVAQRAVTTGLPVFSSQLHAFAQVIPGVRASNDPVVGVDYHHSASRAFFVAQTHAADDRLGLIFLVEKNSDYANYRRLLFGLVPHGSAEYTAG